MKYFLKDIPQMYLKNMFRKTTVITTILLALSLSSPVLIPSIQGATTFSDDTISNIPNESPIKLLRDGEYFATLLQAIKGAEKEIEMAFFLFKTNGYRNNYPDILLHHLTKAAQRGVRIRVLLERGNNIDTSNGETALRLREGGIDVSFDTPDITTHTKVIVIDGRYTFLGSHNLTASALKYNHELSLLIDSPELAMEALHYIDTLYR
jgi:phosphatidylserine/phosphatidylglycerophosphate/cardiolipin synthase-like enzyme